MNDLVGNANNYYGVFNEIDDLFFKAINSIFIINSGPASYLKQLFHKIESVIKPRPFLYDVDFFILTPLHHENLLPPLPEQQQWEKYDINQNTKDKDLWYLAKIKISHPQSEESDYDDSDSDSDYDDYQNFSNDDDNDDLIFPFDP